MKVRKKKIKLFFVFFVVKNFGEKLR